MRTVKDNYFWLDTPYEAGPALSGEQEADVAVVGGGLTGLGAAYFIKQQFPEKKVIVLESEFIGFGSSGRNSGVVRPSVGQEAEQLMKVYGLEKVARLAQVRLESFSLLEELINEHNIDCDYEKTGSLAVAESEKQSGPLEKAVKSFPEVGGNVTWLGREEARSRFRGLNIYGAAYRPDDGMLNPAKYVRGMKKVVESLGVEVYENSPCTRIKPGPEISLHTAGGHIRAANIVMATNAYSNPLGLFRYKVLPCYVYNIVTEPLTQSQMDELHWKGRCIVFNLKRFFTCYRLTADNRLLFIYTYALYFYDVDRDYSHRPSEYQRHYNLLTKRIPFLKGIKVTHQWGGRIGITYDNLPSIGRTGEH